MGEGLSSVTEDPPTDGRNDMKPQTTLAAKLNQMNQQPPQGRHFFGGKHRRIVTHPSGAASVDCLKCGRAVIALPGGVTGTALSSHCPK
jgi:hypothetical protein